MQLYDFTGVGSLSQIFMMSLRAKSPLESEHMNFLHFLLKIYLTSSAECFSGLKRSYRGQVIIINTVVALHSYFNEATASMTVN